MTVPDADALPGLGRISGLLRTVRTPDFAGVTFYEVAAKALNAVPAAAAMPFRWTVNPWRGCTQRMLVDSVALGTAGPSGDRDEPAFRQTRAFARLERRAHEWQRSYTTSAWLDELPTHSGHRTLPPHVLAKGSRPSGN